MPNFIQKLNQQILKTSSVVVGIDPILEYIPDCFLSKIPKEGFLKVFNLKQEIIYVNLWEMCQQIINACQGLVPAIKPQSAFFEQFGHQGVKVLEDVLKYAKEKDLLTILDVKRGDIGSTSTGYAITYLLANPLESDAITINPFLGWETLQSFIKLSQENGKGLFILIRTSNPGGGEIQTALKDGQKVYQILSQKIQEINQNWLEKTENKGQKYGLVGAVVGATKNEDILEIRKLLDNGILLMPGIGSQGGDQKSANKALDEDGLGAIFPSSRSLIFPKPEQIQKLGYQKAVRNLILERVNENKTVANSL